MRAARCVSAVDSHTEGMPTRVITAGVDPIPGATMLDRKLHFEAEMDDLRLLLMREPRFPLEGETEQQVREATEKAVAAGYR